MLPEDCLLPTKFIYPSLRRFVVLCRHLLIVCEVLRDLLALGPQVVHDGPDLLQLPLRLLHLGQLLGVCCPQLFQFRFGLRRSLYVWRQSELEASNVGEYRWGDSLRTGRSRYLLLLAILSILSI